MPPGYRSIRAPRGERTSSAGRIYYGVARLSRGNALLVTVPDRYVGPFGGADVELAGPGDLLLRVAQQLEPVGDPAGGAGNGEQHREHVDGEAHRLVDQPGVEVDVGIELAGDEVVVGEGDLLELEGEVEEGVAAGDLEDPLGGGLDDPGPGV